MTKPLSLWQRYRATIIGSFAVPVVCSVIATEASAYQPIRTGMAYTDAWPVAVTPVAAAAPEQDAPLSLSACRAIALEKQPALAAHRASLAAAQARYRAIEHLGLTAIIAHDMPYRRKQAAISVSIAEAAVNQAEWETAYAV